MQVLEQSIEICERDPGVMNKTNYEQNKHIYVLNNIGEKRSPLVSSEWVSLPSYLTFISFSDHLHCSESKPCCNANNVGHMHHLNKQSITAFQSLMEIQSKYSTV